MTGAGLAYDIFTWESPQTRHKCTLLAEWCAAKVSELSVKGVDGLEVKF